MPRWYEQRPPSPWQVKEDPQTHWKRMLAVARRKDQHPDEVGGILLGTNLAGDNVTITPEILRTHMHVVGGTGVGKSFFLEGMIKKLILDGQGVCVIDPHGDLYERILPFCAHVHQVRPELELDRRVVPVNLAEQSRVIGFNPIQRNARVQIYQVVALMETIRKCWGQTTFQETPRLARWLFNTLYAVIDSGLTFLQTYHMVMPQANPYRQAISARIKNPRIRAEWEFFMSIKSDEKREEKVESCLNRIRPFVEHDVIRPIIGQRTKTLDFRDVLDRQKVVLVNLARQNTIAEDDQHLIGTLLVNELLTASFARRKEERRPYFLCIDEFQHFVTKDICEILDGGRKFGLHLILAHQHLNQLKIKDPEVYYSTLTNARTKVVFGGLIDEDLEVLGKELYTGELNPDEIKDEIWQTKFRPVETTRLVIAESDSAGGSSSRAQISHESLGESVTYIPGTESWAVDLPTTFVSGSGDSKAESEGESWARSRSSTEVPFYEQHEFQELSSRTFRSLEEQLYIKKAQMKRQGTQYATILIPGRNVELVKTPTLNDFSVPYSTQDEFMHACFDMAGCFKRPEDAEREVVELDESLLIAGAAGHGGSATGNQRPDDDDGTEPAKPRRSRKT